MHRTSTRRNACSPGASAFLPKPIDREALLDEIAGQLKLTWTMSHTNQRDRTSCFGAIAVPRPLPTSKKLHRIALTGNMRAIRERAVGIAAQTPLAPRFLRQAAVAGKCLHQSKPS